MFNDSTFPVNVTVKQDHTMNLVYHILDRRLPHIGPHRWPRVETTLIRFHTVFRNGLNVGRVYDLRPFGRVWSCPYWPRWGHIFYTFLFLEDSQNLVKYFAHGCILLLSQWNQKYLWIILTKMSKYSILCLMFKIIKHFSWNLHWAVTTPASKVLGGKGKNLGGWQGAKKWKLPLTHIWDYLFIFWGGANWGRKYFEGTE